MPESAPPTRLQGSADPAVATATSIAAPPLRRAGVAGLGAALPANVVETAEIERGLELDPGWIETRTGVRARRRIADDESLLELAAGASETALAGAGVGAADLDLILFATFTADHLQPHAGPELCARLGADGAAAIDVGAACCGFVAALGLATAQVEAGRAETVLVVGADAMSRVVDRTDRATAGLFGDGAGAAIVSAGGPGAVTALRSGTQTSGLQMITASQQQRLLAMEGRPVFRAAVERLERLTLELLEARGLELGEIDLYVYHQANARILAAVADRLRLEDSRVVSSIAEQGNTSAASVPLALAQAASRGRVGPGARVVLAAFGAGYTWADALLEWERES